MKTALLSLRSTALLAALVLLAACGSDNDRDTPAPPPPNAAPTAVAEASKAAVEAGEQVTLDGSNSSDAEGAIVRYAWRQIAGTSVALSSYHVAAPTFTAPENITEDDTLTFELRVADQGNFSAIAHVTVLVNAPPVAVAPAELTSSPGNFVTLDGSSSRASQGGTIASYAWTQQSPDTLTIALRDADKARAVFATPNVTEETTLVFQLQITDSTAKTSTTTVRVVIDNQAPIASAGDDRTVNAGTTVTLTGAVSDPEGGVLEYAWTVPDGVTLTNPNTLTPTFTAAEVEEDTMLKFTLTVTDLGDRTASASVTVTINARPSIEVAEFAGAVGGGAMLTLNGSGGDAGEGGVTYAWEQTGGPSVVLSDATAAMPTFTTPTQLAATTLTFKLTVTDANGFAVEETVEVEVNGGAFSLDNHDGAVRSVSDIAANMMAVSGGIDGTVRLWNAATQSEVRILGRHVGQVYAVAISTDGSRAISGGIDGYVRVWDTAAGTEVRYEVEGGAEDETRSLAREGIWVYAVALNEDGTRAVSGGFDGKVRFWNTETMGEGAGTEILYGAGDDESLGSHSAIYEAAVAAVTADPSAVPPIPASPAIPAKTHPTSVYAVALSHDGDLALSGGAGGKVYLYDTDPEATGERKTELPNSDDAASVFAAALSGDGMVAASGSADHHVRVWDVSTVGTPNANVTISKKLASGGEDDTADVTSVSLSEDGSRLLSADAKGRTTLWDPKAAADAEEMHTTRQHTDYAWSAGLSSSGLVLSGSADGTVKFYDMTAGPIDTAHPFATTSAELIEDHTSTSDIYSNEFDMSFQDIHVALSADGTRGLAGATGRGADRDAENRRFFRVKLWDTTTTGEEIPVIGEFPELAKDRNTANGQFNINDVALNADGSRAITLLSDNIAYYWKPSDGTVLNNSFGSIAGVSISGDGRFLMATTTNSNPSYHDLASSRLLYESYWSSCDDYSAAPVLSADGRYAITSDLQCTKIQKASLGETSDFDPDLARLGGDFDGNQADLALSADGSRALMVSKSTSLQPGVMRLWDTSNPEAEGFTPEIKWERTGSDFQLALSADGRLALSGGTDDLVRLWDARIDPESDMADTDENARPRLLRVMTGHSGDIHDMALSADGRVAITADATGNANSGIDGKVRVWRIGRSNAASPPPSTIIVDAGAAQTVASGTEVTLDGSGSRDTSGHALVSYGWNQLAGPPVLRLGAVEDDPTKATFTPTLAEGATENVVYEFLLTVVSARYRTKSSDEVVTITVTPPPDPAPATPPATPAGQ